MKKLKSRKLHKAQDKVKTLKLPQKKKEVQLQATNNINPYQQGLNSMNADISIATTKRDP